MNVSRRKWMAAGSSAPAIAAGVVWGWPAYEPVADLPSSAALDALVNAAVKADEIPGAVLLIGRQGRIVHRKAYGYRALEPRRELMTLDTIFDATSLTKVVATTSALTKLFEAGLIRLNDRVTQYLPDFQGGHTDITVRDLATHFSGLRPDLDLQPAWTGYETGIRMALGEKPVAPAGSQFIYSDINFLLLGEIARRLISEPYTDFLRSKIFAPLGMNETRFLPPAALVRRIAPTEKVKGRILRGVVHDTTARYMNGIAGHAGLFTTADDLARFCEAILGGGERNGTRVFTELAIGKFTTPQSPPNQAILRGIGWDIDSPFSANRGELFPLGSFGHTGYTGTSIWMDPVSLTYIVLLTNSVHPRVRPAANSLRGRIATSVAAGMGLRSPGIVVTGYNETFVGAGLRRVVARNASVQTGLDVLIEQRFAPLAGKRLGLVTNHTGLDREGRRNIDRMLEAGLKLEVVFSPEHGLTGTEDRAIENSVDPDTHLPVVSLYSARGRRLSPEMLASVDALVFDIQDIGVRFYTYSTTLGYCLEAAAAAKIPIYVLDRPNPITGTHVEGPVLDRDLVSFVGYRPLPLRHGLTMGELARLFNHEERLGAELTVIALRNWQRGDWFDSTGLLWVNPSPNLRSLNAALLYPGVAMLEGSKNYSVGRGTDAPFEQIGSDWIHGAELAAALDARFIPGLRVYPVRFRPASAALAGRDLEGVRFVVTDREAFDSSLAGLEIATALARLYPGRIAPADNQRLIGNRAVINALAAGEEPRRIQQLGEEAVRGFLALRREHLLYK